MIVMRLENFLLILKHFLNDKQKFDCLIHCDSRINIKYLCDRRGGISDLRLLI